MKIKRVSVNNRKKSIDIETAKGELTLPFSKLSLKPHSKDKIISIYIDSELGNSAVTYRVESGKEDSVHVDAFLDYNKDPDFMRDLVLHKLTVEAIELLKKSELSKHELIRRLGTSPSQLYRLLDPANYRKSVDEMLRLVAVLGYRIDLKLIKEAA